MSDTRPTVTLSAAIDLHDPPPGYDGLRDAMFTVGERGPASLFLAVTIVLQRALPFYRVAYDRERLAGDLHALGIYCTLLSGTVAEER